MGGAREEKGAGHGVLGRRGEGGAERAGKEREEGGERKRRKREKEKENGKKRNGWREREGERAGFAASPTLGRPRAAPGARVSATRGSRKKQGARYGCRVRSFGDRKIGTGIFPESWG